MRLAWLPVFFLTILAGCSDDRASVDERSLKVSGTDNQAIRADILQTAAGYDRQAIGHANRLLLEVDRFLANPDETTQAAVRSAWLEAHRSFSSLIPLIHIAGLDAQLFAIDAWPMEPGFLDSLPEWPDSGIVNDFTLQITSAVLVEQHGITDPGEVSLGFHPIEYFMFARPVSDFIIPEAEGSERDRILRRRTTLQLMATNLSERILLLDETLYPGLELNLTPGVGAEDGFTVLHKLVRASHSTAQHAFAQSGLFVDVDNGHCRYSGTSAESLLAQLETLREIYRKDTALMEILTRVDASTATNLDSTLDQALDVLGSDSTGEEEFARLQLIVSAINHQLGDFERALQMRR